MLDCSIHYETLESPLDCKEIKPVSFKGNRSWIFIWKALLKLKRQSFGHLIQNADSLEKTLMLGKIEEEKGTTEDEMFGWHHQLNGHEFEQALGVDDREAWRAAVHGVAKSGTWLSDWIELNLLIWGIFSLVCVVFDFFHQCLIVFCMQAFCVLRYVYS